MITRTLLVGIWMIGCVSISTAWAQKATDANEPPQAKAAAKAPAAEALSIVAKKIVGRVQYRQAPEAKWQPLAEGTQLTIDSDIRTGLRSKAIFSIGTNAEVTLDRLGVMTIAELARPQKNVVRARVGSKYGRVQFDVKKRDFRNDFVVSSPGSVLALRGTDGSQQTYGNSININMNTGNGNVNNQFNVGAGENSQNGQTPTDTTGGQQKKPNNVGATPGEEGNVGTGGDENRTAQDSIESALEQFLSQGQLCHLLREIGGDLDPEFVDTLPPNLQQCIREGVEGGLEQ